MLFSNEGYCVICGAPTIFEARASWLRDFYVCRNCGSIPRQRALVNVLNKLLPGWRDMEIHESSPCMNFFARECPRYTSSFFLEGVPLGATEGGMRCENLERLTFTDDSFDVFITQDVLEHVFEPTAALREIMRVLTPGGVHIFTTPKHRNLMESYRRAELVNGVVHHIHDPVYHGNPIGDGRALVTWDYGADFEGLVAAWSGYLTSTYVLRDRRHGIDGEYLEVFFTVKERINLVALPGERQAC